METIAGQLPRHGGRRRLFKAILALRALAGTAFSAAFARERCLCCGKPCLWRPLCPSCARREEQSFVPPGSGRCAVCGKLLLGERGQCMECRAGVDGVEAERAGLFRQADGTFPLFPYRLWRKELLCAWKLQDRRSLSPFFAGALSRALSGTGWDAALRDGTCVLVAVPPRPGKLRRRGWDQTDELCTLLRRLHGFAYLRLLVRRSVEQQKKKDRAGRLGSTGTAFALHPDAGRLLGRWARAAGLPEGTLPRGAVLVDDVITTGATVAACTGLLKAYGIRKVHVLSLFMVD